MEDITLRAIRILGEVSLVAAEDTRKTRNLLGRHKISVPLLSYHDHNKERRTPELLKRLKSGASIALVTDAGTPSISDPGYFIVREAIEEAIPVVPVPGPSALIAALSVSGLPTDSFTFIGFVPKRPGKRERLLREVQAEPRPIIFFESPKRLLSLMEDILRIMGDRKAVVARELTKIHEEIIRGSLSHLVQEISRRPAVKGESTLLVAGCNRAREVDRKAWQDHLRDLLHKKRLSSSDLAKEVAREFGVSRKVVYQEVLRQERHG
jgi:16S rRNA (cytidine1402-2'-O)-methyltransferase